MSWFPGHMAKALRLMESRLKLVDLIVEVRDARLPLSSANADLARLAAHKRRLVLLNKTDLADPYRTQAACAVLRSQGLRVIPTMAVHDDQAKRVLDAALSWLSADRPHSDMSLVLVAGMPNTGKSSLINALKRAAQKQGLLEGEQAYHKTAKAGPLPGVTQHLGGFKVCRSPLVYVLDSPGVLQPSLGDPAHAARLALAGLLPPAAAGLDDQLLTRELVKVMVSDPRRRQQLWCAADGLLVRQERRGELSDTAQTHPRRRDGDPRQGQGLGHGLGELGPAGAPSGPSNEEFRSRREQARDLGIARALYEVVSMPQMPPPQWHPGIDDEEERYEPPSAGGKAAGPGSAKGNKNSAARSRSPRDARYPRHDATDGSLDGEAYDDTELRVQELLRIMARGASLDVGRRASLQRSVLEAFRRGALGRYTLDDVRGEGEEVGAKRTRAVLPGRVDVQVRSGSEAG